MSAAAAHSLCEIINADSSSKSLVVRAIVSTIFGRLGKVRDATEARVDLTGASEPVVFEPQKQLWAMEGSAEKWLQCVCGYWFADASLQEVRFVEGAADGSSFIFYYDPAEPINADDPKRNINPEVICCEFT